jgi:hypothetical protein
MRKYMAADGDDVTLYFLSNCYFILQRIQSSLVELVYKL